MVKIRFKLDPVSKRAATGTAASSPSDSRDPRQPSMPWSTRWWRETSVLNKKESDHQ